MPLLSGSRVDISRVGDCRIDCLGCDDEVVSCRDIPHDKRAAAHDLLHARNRQMGQLVAALGCILWFALNGFFLVRAPVADSMASRVGRARHRLLRRIFLVPNPEQRSASQLKRRRDELEVPGAAEERRRGDGQK
jgi:hypothetical protein